MPHYADGTEAKVGDQVTGKLYNTEGVRAGTIVSITPGSDSCNARVAFIEAVSVDPSADVDPIAGKVPRMAFRNLDSDPGYSGSPLRFRLAHGENHGTTGPRFALFECEDYCAVNELTKVG